MNLSFSPYGIFAALRNFFYDIGLLASYKAALPVICIGNLSVGGNGKTPLVLWLCSLLRQRAKNPVILSRGYGGSLSGPYVLKSADIPSQVGDEPLMLKKKSDCPVVISKRRVSGIQLIEKERLGDCVILDDGFQHRALKRDLDIVCAYVGSENAAQDFEVGRLLPFGRFRESKAQGLARAKAIVFTSRSLTPLSPELIRRLGSNVPAGIEIFSAHLKLEVISRADGATIAGNPRIEIDAFCGLAQPEAFFSSLESLGLSIVNRHMFRDHKNYSTDDLDAIISQSNGRPIVCSEKDAVKLMPAYCNSFFVTKTRLEIDNSEAFLNLVLKYL